MGYLRNPAQGWPSRGGRVKGWGGRNPTVWVSSMGIHNLQLLGGLVDSPKSAKNVNVYFIKAANVWVDWRSKTIEKL